MKLAQKLVVNYLRARLNILAVISKKRAAKKAFEIFSTPFRKPKRKTPPIFKKAEKLSFQLDAKTTIRGYRFNHPSKDKVLILHGFESASKNFDRYISALVRKGYEVLAFDAPAHGLSDGKRIILPMYVETIKTIYNLYGPINKFMAHSFGGLALAHFLEFIEHDNTTKAVFIAPATETTTAINTFFAFLDLSPEVRKEFDQLIYEKAGVYAEHFSVRRAMHQIKANCLWLHDEDDDLTPLSDALKVREDAHPHLEFYITKGLGHRKIYRDNNVKRKIVEFL